MHRSIRPRTTRQPGARHAPYCFVSSLLFGGDISRIYESIEVPVWMVHGVRGDFVDYRHKRTVEARPNWTIRVFQTGALPHFEVPEEFTREYDAFRERARTLGVNARRPPAISTQKSIN